jgi:hypothetical protein
VDAEVMDFGTLLDNAVFKPSRIALGDDARRLALLQVLPNLRAAAEEITAASRRHRQHTVRIAIEGWHTDLPTDPAQSVDASALADHLEADLLARTEEQAKKVDRNPVRLFGGGIGGAALALVTPWVLAEALFWPVVLIGVALVGWGLMDLNRVPAQRKRIREAGVLQRRRAQHTLSQVLSQRIRFFSDWNAHLTRLHELRDWDPMGK